MPWLLRALRWVLAARPMRLLATARGPADRTVPVARFSIAQKWSKGKVKDKAANLVLFDEEVYAKLYKEVPKFKLITTSIMSDRLKINGSLARHAIKELMAKGSIRMVTKHSAQGIYTRATNA